ncbi:hypothetical protein FGO68_gene7549 [Halteria grandinella]|uniref:Uncharacterized protein n=1 Tax=Halteria grandinella TaxID=5974 RepID=A0A8J8T899_HALGN|nr:hypothetical protein FGO68_gene7549 [Halteria grandinella]
MIYNYANIDFYTFCYFEKALNDIQRLKEVAKLLQILFKSLNSIGLQHIIHTMTISRLQGEKRSFIKLGIGQ